MSTIEERVLKVINETFPRPRLTDELEKDLGADSLHILELIMELEDEFGINIPTNRVEQVKTVGDIIKLLEEHCDQANEECE